MKATNCVLTIMLLIMTALLALVIVLIVMTGEPEFIFPKARHGKNGTSTMKKTTTTTTVSTMEDKSELPEQTSDEPTASTTTSQATSTTESASEQVLTTTTSAMEINGIENVPTFRLRKITDIIFKNPGKIVGLSVRTGKFLHVAKSHGEIDILNATSNEFLRHFKVDMGIHRLDYLDDDRMVIAEMINSTLNVLDVEGRVIKEIKLDYSVLDLRINGGRIFVLSRTSPTIFVYDQDLEITNEIGLTLPQESCNFILPYGSTVFISCQSSVLRINIEGSVVGKTATPGSSYSLALLRNGSEIWAAQRGRQEIHVYSEELILERRIQSYDDAAALWSNIVLFEDTLFTLDYFMNSVTVFNIEKDASTNDSLLNKATR